MTLEFMDRVLISFGNSILSSLFWSLKVPSDKVLRGRTFHFIMGLN